MASDTKKNRNFYTTRQAAEKLGVSLTTVQLWVETGILPAWKTAGGHRRLPFSVVDSFFNEQLAASAVIPSNQALRVLVVEDEPVQRELYRIQCSQWGLDLDLHLAENGFDGLLQAGRVSPHLVISDLLMPGMDGFQMIRHLRKHLTDIKRIVVVTALTAAEIDSGGGLPADVTVYQKPIPFQLLRTLCEQHLGNNKRARSLP